MDSLSTQKTKSRKIEKLTKESHVQKKMDLFFWTIEMIVVLITVANLCYQLVITFQDYGIAVDILANRNLAFVVGNVIVIYLIAKSGLLVNQELAPKCKSNDLYDEFVRESSRRYEISRATTSHREIQRNSENEAKQNIAKQNIVEHQDIAGKKMEKQNLTEKRESQSYRRSRSENLEGLEKSSCGVPRRSETDLSCEIFDSDDELRYKIESFIARQKRNHNDD